MRRLQPCITSKHLTAGIELLLCGIWQATHFLGLCSHPGVPDNLEVVIISECCLHPAGLSQCRVACRHAEDRLDVPHRLAHHGGLPADLWGRPGGHSGHPAVEPAGLVAGVPAAGAGAALLPSPQVRRPSLSLLHGRAHCVEEVPIPS